LKQVVDDWRHERWSRMGKDTRCSGRAGKRVENGWRWQVITNSGGDMTACETKNLEIQMKREGSMIRGNGYGVYCSAGRHGETDQFARKGFGVKLAEQVITEKD